MRVRLLTRSRGRLRVRELSVQVQEVISNGRDRTCLGARLKRTSARA